MIMKQQSTTTRAMPMTSAMAISLVYNLFQQLKLQVASLLWRDYQAECYRLKQRWP